MQPLDGLHILDLTTVLSGPYATSLLADLGADVVKVEPTTGDAARSFDDGDGRYLLDGMTPYLLTLGRNKRSVVIDLRHDDGRAAFYDLVRWADVVVDNYRTGVAERLRVDHASLAAVNPRIVTCSITGYGQTGPARDRPAFDACIQAYAGVMSITGEPDGAPMRAGPLYADLASGMAAAIGILGAVVGRERSGAGRHVDISMLDVQVSLLSYTATMALLSGLPAGRYGNEHPFHVPYNAFEARDGFLFLAINTDAHWRALVDALQRVEAPAELHEALDFVASAELATRHGRLQRRAAVNDALARILRSRGRQSWLDDLVAAGVPVAPVNGVHDALADPQVLARNMVVELSHPNGTTYRAPGNPIKLSGLDDGRFSPPPLLGQHTSFVLRDILGYDDERIEALLASGAVVQGE